MTAVTAKEARGTVAAHDRANPTNPNHQHATVRAGGPARAHARTTRTDNLDIDQLALAELERIDVDALTVEQLAHVRERRFQLREELIRDDPFISDKLAAALLDRTLWTSKDICRETGWTPGSFLVMRSGGGRNPAARAARAAAGGPHPSLWLVADAVAPGRGTPLLWEAGRCRHHLEMRGGFSIDPDTWKLIADPEGPLHVGRVRHPETVIGRAGRARRAQQHDNGA